MLLARPACVPFLILAAACLAAPASAATLTFQQGDGGSFSTTDAAWTLAAQPSTNFGSDAVIQFGFPNQAAGLLRFPDLIGAAAGQIPVGAVVSSATLTLTVTNTSVDPNSHDNFGGDPGHDAGTEYGAAPVLTFSAPALGALDLSVTSLVQAWVSGAANHGFFFLGNSNDSIIVHSDDGATAAARPKPTVVFDAAVPEPSVAALGAGIGLRRLRRVRSSRTPA